MEDNIKNNILTPQFINSFKNIYKGRINTLDEFILIYSGLVNQNNIVPLFSQTNKYDLFPKKRVFNKFKTRNINAWTPSIPKDDIDKIKKGTGIVVYRYPVNANDIPASGYFDIKDNDYIIEILSGNTFCLPN